MIVIIKENENIGTKKIKDSSLNIYIYKLGFAVWKNNMFGQPLNHYEYLTNRPKRYVYTSIKNKL